MHQIVPLLLLRLKRTNILTIALIDTNLLKTPRAVLVVALFDTFHQIVNSLHDHDIAINLLTQIVQNRHGLERRISRGSLGVVAGVGPIPTDLGGMSLLRPARMVKILFVLLHMALHVLRLEPDRRLFLAAARVENLISLLPALLGRPASLFLHWLFCLFFLLLINH